VPVRVAAGLALLVGLGTVLLWLPISGAERQLTLSEAFFTALSALATTGLSVITPGRDLSLFGQVVLLLLMQVGGIGFMVGAVIVFRLLGRRISLEERLSLRDALGSISADAVLFLTRRVIAGVLLIEAIGAGLLWLNWAGRLGRLEPGQTAFYALFHAVSAFTNCSFDLFSQAPDAPAAFPTDAGTLLLLAVLVILGSLGRALHYSRWMP
jgi:trk system potassium uptake protein TrkH